MRWGIEMREIVTVLFGLGLMGNALLFVPQALAVWRKKSDEGISLMTFGGFCVLQAISVMRTGSIEHDWAMVLGMAASLLTCGSGNGADDFLSGAADAGVVRRSEASNFACAASRN